MMRFYYQTENGFTELKYHGKASRLPTYRDGRVYGTYTRADGAVISYKDKEYKYGEYEYTDPVDILVPFDTSYTIMDEQSSTKITLLCSDQEVIQPGTLVQLVYFKNDDGSWLPQDKDGKPHNYSNWVILSSNAQYFDHIDVHGKRYKHTYEMEEALTCFKDYPVRSSKTFAGGRYTYREVLDITLRLFFKPRVHLSSYAIKDNPLLDEPNSKLSYTNATVFDVVADIGRILDLTPNVEVKYEGGKYVYTLEYLPNYGTIGEEVDISYFDLANADTETSTRDTHAGAVISNVQNLVTDEGTSYPAPGVGLYPGDTNANADPKRIALPLPIKDVKNIKIYYRTYISNEDTSAYYKRTIYYWNGEAVLQSGADAKFADIYDMSKPIIISNKGTDVVDPYRPDWSNIDIYGSAKRHASNAKQFFIAEASASSYLYDELPDKTLQTKENTIFYTRGSVEIDLTPLFQNTYMYFGIWGAASAGEESVESYFKFSDTNISQDPPNQSTNQNTMHVTTQIKPLIEIEYEPYISAALVGDGVVDSNTTVFFNQYGQVVSAKSFGNAIGNYADEMSGSSRIVGKIAEPVGGKSFYDLYRELPQVGCTVVDHERNKRYVLSQLSVTRQPQSLDILAQLNERKKGRSQVVQADNQQYIAQIPDSEIQESKSACVFRLWIDTKPIQHKEWDEFGHESIVDILLNPLTQSKTFAKDVVMNFVGANSLVLFPLTATLTESIFFSFRFNDNRIAGSSSEGVVLYTDANGEIGDAGIYLYNTNDSLSVAKNYPLFSKPNDAHSPFAVFNLPLKKDAYEQTNITIQMIIKPCGALALGRGYIDKTPFGKKSNLYNDELRLLFFNRIVDGVDLTTPVLSTSASFQKDDYRNELLLWWDDKTPTHKAWALLSGDDVLLFSNEPIKETNNLQEAILYFDLSLYTR